jgi:hypothetical protein
MPPQPPSTKPVPLTLNELQKSMSLVPDVGDARYSASGFLKFPSDGDPLPSEWEGEVASTPTELDGWLPIGPGLVGPKGCLFENIKVAYQNTEQPFRRFTDALVAYDVVLLDGTRRQYVAEYFREKTPNLETLYRLERHFDQIGPALDSESAPSGDAPLAPTATQWQEANFQITKGKPHCFRTN